MGTSMVLLSACGQDSTIQTVPLASPMVTVSNTAVSTMQPIAMRIYTNKTFGFDISLPNTWGTIKETVEKVDANQSRVLLKGANGTDQQVIITAIKASSITGDPESIIDGPGMRYLKSDKTNAFYYIGVECGGAMSGASDCAKPEYVAVQKQLSDNIAASFHVANQ